MARLVEAHGWIEEIRGSKRVRARFLRDAVVLIYEKADGRARSFVHRLILRASPHFSQTFCCGSG